MWPIHIQNDRPLGTGELSSFYRGLQFYRLSGRIIPTLLENGWGFPGIGSPSTFWPFMVSLGTVMVPMGVSFSLQVY